MNYLQSFTYLESLAPTTQKPCLERLAAFMQANGNLQNNYQSIHVTGTNGKGSTVALLDSVLRRTGNKVGRFTGPHLLRWNERFHIDGQPISDSDFACLASRLKDLSEDFGRQNQEFGRLTWFELLTAMSFFYFSENAVDFAVFEVGLGGRWDATNVLEQPLISIITNVDLDHTQILGGTVTEIAGEKAGIIKRGVPVVTAATGDALNVISQVARQSESDLYICRLGQDIAYAASNGDAMRNLSEPSYLTDARRNLGLLGSHQQLNAQVTTAALLALSNNPKLKGRLEPAVADGFRHVYWPGRMQFLRNRHLLLDGAHNPAGALALRLSLDELCPEQPINFVLACFENKDVGGLIRHLVRPRDRVWVSQAESKRARCAPDILLKLIGAQTASATACVSVRDALHQALQTSLPGELVVVTGSFATVAESMLALGWNQVEDGQPETTPGPSLYQAQWAFTT